jgi:predicted RNase H-like nuclease
MNRWQDTEVGKKFIVKAFADAGMPEVEKSNLEPGTYTNEELAGFFTDSLDLWHALHQLRFQADPTVKRSILSFAVESMPKK